MLYFFYKIICEDLPDYIYIGSTRAFSQRKANHKHNSTTKNTILYKTIRENGGWNNWKMVLIEKCDCDNSQKAHIKEEDYRLKLNANLNSIKSFICDEDYVNYNKNYYAINKDKMIKQITDNNKKDKRKDYTKQYYLSNKEIIKCDICNCEIVKNNFNNHLQSKKHINNLIK